MFYSVSLQSVVMRVSELNQLLTPQPITPTTATPATSSTTGTGASTDFSSMLQGAMSPGGTSTTATGGAGALARVATPAGGVGQKMVQIAAGELGVTESPPGSNNSPRIAQYRSATAGSPGPGPWCAYFVSWVAQQAGAPIMDNGSGSGSVDAIRAWGERTGRGMPNTATPQPGDLILFNQHIGLVESVDPNGTIHTIEGNSSNMVTRRTHQPSEATGFVRMS
jgi:cell wall-associated NlpC family hydrolase